MGFFEDNEENKDDKKKEKEIKPEVVERKCQLCPAF